MPKPTSGATPQLGAERHHADKFSRERDAQRLAATQAAFQELVGTEHPDRLFHERVRAAHPDPFDPLHQLPEQVPGLVVNQYKEFLRRLLADGHSADELRQACADWNRHLVGTEPFWFGPLAHRFEFRYLAHYRLGLDICTEQGPEAGLAVLLDDPETARLRFATSRAGKKRHETSEEKRAKDRQLLKS
jgi:hypothetical protein